MESFYSSFLLSLMPKLFRIMHYAGKLKPYSVVSKDAGLILENTRLTDPRRVKKLIAVLAISFCWCYLTGEWQHNQKGSRLADPMSMEGSGAAGALVKMAGCPSGGSTLVYFSCEDCSVEAERAAAHGGEIFKGKMSIGEHGFIAMVVDTEGNMIGLHSMQ